MAESSKFKVKSSRFDVYPVAGFTPRWFPAGGWPILAASVVSDLLASSLRRAAGRDVPAWHWLGLVAMLWLAGCTPAPPKLLVENARLPVEAVFRLGDEAAWSAPELDDSAWKPVRLDQSWHEQGLTPDGRVGHFGWYRLRVPVEPGRTNAWMLSAGFVGNISELWLNGVRIGGVGSFVLPEVTAQRTVHAAVVPPGLLRPGTNLFAVRVHNVVGAGGILGGPVGLFPAEMFARTWKRYELQREATRVAVAALCLGWSLVPALFRVVGDDKREFAGAGWPAFLLGVQVLLFTQVLNAHEIKEFSALLALLAWLISAFIPPSLFGLARNLAGPSRFWDVWVWLGLAAYLPASFALARRLDLLLAAYAAYLGWVLTAILWRSLRAPPERRWLGRALAAGSVVLGIGGALDALLTFFPLLPQAALWWDPMDFAVLIFLFLFGGSLLRRHVLARRRELELGARLVSTHSEERRQIGRQLHDGVLQDVLHWRMRAEMAALAESPEEARAALAEVGGGLAGAAGELRTLAEDLQPLVARDVPLAEALRRLADRFEQRYGVTVMVESRLATELPAPVRETLYRIAQEAVNNACRHSGAKEITVSLGEETAGSWLEVRDAGQGFDPGAVPSGHLGLRFLRDHAEWIGGRLSVQSAPGCGTSIRVELPLPTAAR